jgi:hypothetical protein
MLVKSIKIVDNQQETTDQSPACIKNVSLQKKGSYDDSYPLVN